MRNSHKIKTGDLVYLRRKVLWGGYEKTGETAMAVKRTYQSYNEENDVWSILIKGCTESVRQWQIRRIS